MNRRSLLKSLLLGSAAVAATACEPKPATHNEPVVETYPPKLPAPSAGVLPTDYSSPLQHHELGTRAIDRYGREYFYVRVRESCKKNDLVAIDDCGHIGRVLGPMNAGDYGWVVERDPWATYRG